MPPSGRGANSDAALCGLLGCLYLVLLRRADDCQHSAQPDAFVVACPHFEKLFEFAMRTVGPSTGRPATNFM